jgi:hypothetical protein
MLSVYCKSIYFPELNQFFFTTIGTIGYNRIHISCYAKLCKVKAKVRKEPFAVLRAFFVKLRVIIVNPEKHQKIPGRYRINMNNIV